MQIGGWTLHACLLLTFPTRSCQKQMAERGVWQDAECHLSVGGPCLVASSWTGRDHTARVSMCPGAEHTQACRPGFFIQLGQGRAKKVVFKKVRKTLREDPKRQPQAEGRQGWLPTPDAGRSLGRVSPEPSEEPTLWTPRFRLRPSEPRGRLLFSAPS